MCPPLEICKMLAPPLLQIRSKKREERVDLMECFEEEETVDKHFHESVP